MGPFRKSWSATTEREPPQRGDVRPRAPLRAPASAITARAAAGHNLFEGGGSRAGGDDVVPVELPPPVTEANPTRNDVATVVARMTIDEVRFCCLRCFLLLLFSPYMAGNACTRAADDEIRAFLRV